MKRGSACPCWSGALSEEQEHLLQNGPNEPESLVGRPHCPLWRPGKSAGQLTCPLRCLVRPTPGGVQVDQPTDDSYPLPSEELAGLLIRPCEGGVSSQEQLLNGG